MDIYQIITGIGALIGTISGIIALILQRKKTQAEAERTDAETADIIQGAAKELIEQYKARVEELTKETVVLKTEVSELKAEIKILKEKISELEHKLVEVAVENRNQITTLQTILDTKIREVRDNINEIKSLKDEINQLQERIKVLTKTTKGEI